MIVPVPRDGNRRAVAAASASKSARAKCPYVSIVVVIDSCPSWRWITGRGVPSLMCQDEKLWRRS